MRREASGAAALLALLAALAALAALDAGAQVVRGTVSSDGVRVPGAIVLLVDSAERTAGRAAAREDGTFVVTAPAGSYRLRVLRIGFAPTVVGPLALTAGATATRDVALTGAPVRLAEVRVADRARCRVRPDGDAASLLAEAQKALLGEAITRADVERSPLTMRVTTAERTLAADGARVLSEARDARAVASVRPFASLPADSLARVGYVARDADGGATYWAPDADVLLSESFAASHCFRVEPPAADSGRLARWIGVGFAPAAQRAGVVDVEGVLWLDRATAELRELAYRYVHLGDDAPIAARAGAGGRVELLRLPDGGWIVHRWSIRVPVVGVRSPAARTIAIVPGMRPLALPARELAGIRVAEGDVSEVRRGERVLWERGRVALRVRVVDEARGEPVPGAVVTLDGDDGAAAVAAHDGMATLLRVRPGPHALHVRTAALDVLRAAPAPRDVRADADAEPLVIAIPSERDALARACGAHVVDWHEGLLRGTVEGATADVRVETAWQTRYVRLGGGAPVVAPERRERAVDASGAFTLCGVPRDVDVTVRALRGTTAGRAVTIRIPSAAVGHVVSLVP